jgi:hypothetical protein
VHSSNSRYAPRRVDRNERSGLIAAMTAGPPPEIE